MRLTDKQRRVIEQAARACFGDDALVRVFGSRVDDSKRGGDIDLLITTSLSNMDEIVRAEIAFQVRVQRALGEQRIDVLVDYPGRRERPPIFDIAERTGVRL
jgi:predicted nucleotidyltransferase